MLLPKLGKRSLLQTAVCRVSLPAVCCSRQTFRRGFCSHGFLDFYDQPRRIFTAGQAELLVPWALLLIHIRADLGLIKNVIYTKQQLPLSSSTQVCFQLRPADACWLLECHAFRLVEGNTKKREELPVFLLKPTS